MKKILIIIMTIFALSVNAQNLIYKNGHIYYFNNSTIAWTLLDTTIARICFPYGQTLTTDLFWTSTNGSIYSLSSKDSENNLGNLIITPTESMLASGQNSLTQSYISTTPRINTTPAKVKFRVYGLDFPYNYLDIEMDTVGLLMVPNGNTDTSKFTDWHYVPKNWVQKRIDTLNNRTLLAQHITVKDTTRWGLLQDSTWQSIEVTGQINLGQVGSLEENQIIIGNENFTKHVDIDTLGVHYTGIDTSLLGDYDPMGKDWINNQIDFKISNGFTGNLKGSLNVHNNDNTVFLKEDTTNRYFSSYTKSADNIYFTSIYHDPNSLSLQKNNNTTNVNSIINIGTTFYLKMYKHGSGASNSLLIDSLGAKYDFAGGVGDTINWTDNYLVNKKWVYDHTPIIITGTDTTNSTPSKKGNIFVDDSGNVYVSKNSSRGGWVKLNWFIPILFFRRKKFNFDKK
jgi:hypothetical protein